MRSMYVSKRTHTHIYVYIYIHIFNTAHMPSCTQLHEHCSAADTRETEAGMTRPKRKEHNTHVHETHTHTHVHDTNMLKTRVEKEREKKRNTHTHKHKQKTQREKREKRAKPTTKAKYDLGKPDFARISTLSKDAMP